MPMTWTVEQAFGGAVVRVRTYGIFNLPDYIRMVDDIITQVYWKPGLDTFFDHRNLDFCETDFMTLWTASSQHKDRDARIGAGRAAILMKHLGDYGVGRMFQNISDDKISVRLKIFTDEGAALEWLDVKA